MKTGEDDGPGQPFDQTGEQVLSRKGERKDDLIRPLRWRGPSRAPNRMQTVDLDLVKPPVSTETRGLRMPATP